MTDTSAANATAAKVKRDPGPLEILFLDAADKASTRVPEGVKKLKVVERATKAEQVYDLSQLPQTVLMALAAAGAKRFIETSARNGADEHGTNVISSADKMFATMISGKLYSRTGDGSAKDTETFDYDFWLDVVKVRTKRLSGLDATPAQLEDFKTRLEALTPKERREKIANWKKDETFNAAFLAVKSARAMAAAKAVDATKVSLDLF